MDPNAPGLPLKVQRGHLLESTKHHTVEVDTFGRDIAPLLNSEAECSALVNHVVGRLTTSKDWDPVTGWADTSKVPGDEDATFKGLADIAEKIHDICAEWDKAEGKLGPRKTPLFYESRYMAYSEVLGGSMVTDARSVRVLSATPKERRPKSKYTFHDTTYNPPTYADEDMAERRYNSDIMAIFEGKLKLEKRAEVCLLVTITVINDTDCVEE